MRESQCYANAGLAGEMRAEMGVRLLWHFSPKRMSTIGLQRGRVVGRDGPDGHR